MRKTSQAVCVAIEPDILTDPVLFLPTEAINKAGIIMSLGPGGRTKLHAEIWQRFLSADPPGT